jgi:hypothetical protein
MSDSTTNPREEPEMAGVEVREFTAADEVREPEKTRVEVVRLAGDEVGRYTFEPGWRWSECIKPIVETDSCQVEHVGYLVSGALRVEHQDGTVRDVSAGSVYRIAPGHDASVVGDEPAVAVEFQGAARYARK